MYMYLYTQAECTVFFVHLHSDCCLSGGQLWNFTLPVSCLYRKVINFGAFLTLKCKVTHAVLDRTGDAGVTNVK